MAIGPRDRDEKKPKWREPRHYGRPPDPDADWNLPDTDPKASLELGQATLKKIEEAPPDVWRRATRFFEDVEAKIKEVLDSIRRTGKVSRGQEKALAAWGRAIDKCLTGRQDET